MLISKDCVILKFLSLFFGSKYANNAYKIFRISWEFILRWAKDSEKYDEEQLKMKIINAIKDQGLFFVSTIHELELRCVFVTNITVLRVTLYRYELWYGLNSMFLFG